MLPWAAHPQCSLWLLGQGPATLRILWPAAGATLSSEPAGCARPCRLMSLLRYVLLQAAMSQSQCLSMDIAAISPASALIWPGHAASVVHCSPRLSVPSAMLHLRLTDQHMLSSVDAARSSMREDEQVCWTACCNSRVCHAPDDSTEAATTHVDGSQSSSLDSANMAKGQLNF